MRYIPFFSLFLVMLLFFSCGENEKKQDSEHQFTNALIDETSPYLLQHAHNPVDWKPWSQEALDQAKNENKLVLVSIGYSSCHWCHVMVFRSFVMTCASSPTTAISKYGYVTFMSNCCHLA